MSNEPRSAQSERIEAAAKAAERVAEEALALESEASYAYGMLGGDVGVTDEERERWRNAPTAADVAQAVRDAFDQTHARTED